MQINLATIAKLSIFLCAASAGRVPVPPPPPPLDASDVRVANIDNIRARFEHHNAAFIGALTDVMLAGITNGHMDLLKYLTPNDMKTMTTNVCGFAILHGSYLTSDAFNAASQECIAQMITRIASGMDARDITAIPEKWFKLEGDALLRAILARSADNLGHFNEDVIKYINKKTDDHELCKIITAASLTNLPAKLRKLFKPECFADITGIPATNFLLKDFPDNILANYNGALHNGTRKSMSSKQVANFGKNIDASDAICTEVELNDLKKNELGAVSRRCLIGYINSGKNLGAAWINVKSNLLAKLTQDEAEFIEKIPAADYVHMPTGIVQAIIDADAESMAEGITALHQKAVDIKVTPAQFATIAIRSPALAGWILTKAKTLDSKILSKCGDVHFENMTAINSKSKTFSGIEVLDILATHTAYKDILANLSTETEQSHACTLMKHQSDYTGIRVAKDLTDDCRKAVGFAVNDVDFLKQAPEFGGNADGAAAIAEKFTTDDWKKATRSFVFTVTRQKAFCSHFTNDIFKNLSSKVHDSIGSPCLLKVKDVVTLETMKNFGDDWASSFGKKDFAFKLTELTPEQFKNVSRDVDVTEHVFSDMTEEIFASLPATHTTAMSNHQWAATPAPIFKKVTPAIIESVSAASLDSVTDEQISSLPEATLLALSADQLTQLGVKSNATLKSVLALGSKLSEKQVEALAARKISMEVAATATGSKSHFWYYVIGGGIFACVAIGAAVYFFVFA